MSVSGKKLLAQQEGKEMHYGIVVHYWQASAATGVTSPENAIFSESLMGGYNGRQDLV